MSDAPFALVWIDFDHATILRWSAGAVLRERIASNVPARERSTAHIRHDPRVRHGGSGRGQDDEQQRRNQHLRAFLAGVADRLSDDTGLEIIGTGTAGQRLATLLRRRRAGRPDAGEISVVRSEPLTARQLAVRLRQHLGLAARRRTVGAYRWSGERILSRARLAT
ncbi:MAG: hypothetical protein ABI622_01665 [Chloroflexota bacterium]